MAVDDYVGYQNVLQLADRLDTQLDLYAKTGGQAVTENNRAVFRVRSRGQHLYDLVLSVDGIKIRDVEVQPKSPKALETLTNEVIERIKTEVGF